MDWSITKNSTNGLKNHEITIKKKKKINEVERAVKNCKNLTKPFSPVHIHLYGNRISRKFLSKNFHGLFITIEGRIDNNNFRTIKWRLYFRIPFVPITANENKCGKYNTLRVSIHVKGNFLTRVYVIITHRLFKDEKSFFSPPFL